MSRRSLLLIVKAHMALTHNRKGGREQTQQTNLLSCTQTVLIRNSASLVCLRLRFVIFASFEMVDFGFLWDLRADEYI